jgi:hypothetical protein
MRQQLRARAGRVADRVVPGRARSRARRAEVPTRADLERVKRRLTLAEREIQELRQVNRRLADVIDVVTELLVPAVDRDDATVKEALDRLGAGSHPPEGR